MTDQPDVHRTPGALVITPMVGDHDAAAFRALNEQWITASFDLVAADREVLGDPRSAVVDRGGQVFLARSGDEVVGCVAVVPMTQPAVGATWELSKMAVSPRARRRGVGRALMEHALAHARAERASDVLLGSNTVHLAPAVRLYESFGFERVATSAPVLPYARADVFLRLSLTP